ncbi:MAG: YbjN domain-containing protein [Alphaproteobacteria bacterium]|nr:YbjN domain-containing protein [Alphaproteobacteria bacterium]
MPISNDNFEEQFMDDFTNPLDGVENILVRQNWKYSRMNRDELFLELKGKHGIYRMMFMWNDSQEVMQFCAEYDLRLADFNYEQACRTINEINTNLWLGHFQLPAESMIPCFRYTQMLKGLNVGMEIVDHLEELIQITMEECDMHYPAFMMLASEKTHDEDQLALALMPAAGLS